MFPRDYDLLRDRSEGHHQRCLSNSKHAFLGLGTPDSWDDDLAKDTFHPKFRRPSPPLKEVRS
jgi:hypothetical protein